MALDELKQEKDSDKEYQNLDTPEEFEEKAEQISERSRNLELFVLFLIAGRLREIGKSGKPLTDKIKKEDLRKIAEQTHLAEVLTKADMNRLLESAVRDMYKDSKIFYEATKTEYPSLSENTALQEILEEFKRGVLKDKRFLTQAFMLRNPKNRTQLIATPLSEAYNEVINQAAEQITKGVGDYTSAIRKIVKTMTDNGMKTVEYDPESGKKFSQSTDAAVKRNILDNIRDISQRTSDEIGKQYGSDGKELSVHEHSAPDHEPLQGHQFTNEEYEKMQTQQDFEDYKGRHFKAIQRRIGIWNCCHFAFSILLGIKKPNFTDEELQANIDRNHEGYTDENGKHRTLYECSQVQRKYEREIRNAKRGQVIAREAGDIELARQYQMEINEKMAEYLDFSEKCGLQPHKENMTIPGYRKIKV